MADKYRRKKEPKHIRLYASITGCDAWRHLSGNAVKVLLALVARDDGTRNGQIGFSCREAADLTLLSPRTAWRCLIELQEKGFIVCTEKGGFSRKISHSTLWRYTWAAWPAGKKGPTRDFENWKPENKPRLQNLSGAVAVSAGNLETPASAVEDFTTDELEIPQVSDVSNLAKTTTLIISQGLPPDGRQLQQRKHADYTSGAVSPLFQFNDLAELRNCTLAHIEGSGLGTQAHLAQLIGCPPGTFSKFINGRGLPSKYRGPLIEAMEACNAA